MRLLMDTDATNGMLNKSKSSCTNIRELAVNALNQCNNTVGSSFISPGATEFQTLMQEWKQKVDALCNEWETLDNRLSREIAEWVEMASKLAG